MRPQHLTVASSCDGVHGTLLHRSSFPTRALPLPTASLSPPSSRPPYRQKVSRTSSYHPLKSPHLVFRLQRPSTPSPCPPSIAQCLSNQTDPSSCVLPTPAYQQRARVPGACGDRNSRPPNPQIDRRKSRPHLCGRAPPSATNFTTPLYRYSRGWVALDKHHCCLCRGPTCRRTRAARSSCPPST